MATNSEEGSEWGKSLWIKRLAIRMSIFKSCEWMTVSFTIAIFIDFDVFSFCCQKRFKAKYRRICTPNTCIFMISNCFISKAKTNAILVLDREILSYLKILVQIQLAMKIVQQLWRSSLQWILVPQHIFVCEIASICKTPNKFLSK